MHTSLVPLTRLIYTVAVTREQGGVLSERQPCALLEQVCCFRTSGLRPPVADDQSTACFNEI